MKPIVVLDSTPLALVVHRRGLRQADACRTWAAGLVAAGVRLVVPEIVDDEVRRELTRLDKRLALAALDTFITALPDRFLPLDSTSLRLPARLWAQARQRGTPTADRHALDIDVILAAQLRSQGLAPTDFVVATSNVSHPSQFVPAQAWAAI